MAGFFSEQTLEQVRAANDIVEIIGASLPLKRAGANFRTLCPFHKEKTPSFNVNPHRQIFHCFGCHKGGDVFRWIQEYENLSFPEAVRRLAERARIPLEMDRSPENQQARSLKDSLLQIHEQITQRWQTALKNDGAAQIARDYLDKRGVTSEAIQIFRLGYAPDAWDDTVNWGKSKNYEPALLEKAGLVLPRDGGGYYDRFRGRLMFPICDEQGRVIAFSGRILTDEKTAKYVNSPETPIFTKGKVFFGLDKTKRAILDAGFAIICEGQLDLIACYMAGVKNMVAPQGTAFTADHARILKRYVNEVVLCFDSDTAGQAAAARVQESLLASGLSVRVATVPAPDDPDSFIKAHGGPAFQELISRAREFFEFYLDHLCAIHDARTEKGQLEVVKAMGEMVRKTGDAVLIDKYAQKTSMKLSAFMQLPVSADAVRTQFKKADTRRQMPREHVEAEGDENATNEQAPSPGEMWVLRFVLGSDEHLDWLAAHLELDWIQHPRVRNIIAARLQGHADRSWIGVAAYLNSIDDPLTQRLINEAVLLRDAHHAKGVDPHRNLVDGVRMLRDRHIDRRLKALNAQLAHPLSDEQVLEIDREKACLRRWKGEPLRPRGEA